MFVIPNTNWFLQFYNFFYIFNVSNLCIVHPWKRPYFWPKHVRVHYVYKRIKMYLCAFVCTIVFYEIR